MDRFETPILYLMFNRPDLVKQTFPKIKEMRPKFLYVAADGPRENNEEDERRCQECRDWLLNEIDWECEFKTLFRSENLGCGLAVSEAITWFFEQVESGVILEDDIYCDISYFYFTQEMLIRYKDVDDILFISGSNFQMGHIRGDGDYYYSKFPNIWGWATWKNRWEKYNYYLTIGEVYQLNILEKIPILSSKKLWLSRMNQISQEFRKTIWDYQWYLKLIESDSFSIVPNKNLVINIGIGSNATHTFSFSDNYKKNRLSQLDPPYTPPDHFHLNNIADTFHYEKFFKSKTSLPNQLRNIAYKLIPPKAYSRLKSFFGK